MTERELFLYELSGRGFEFKNKTWLSGLGEHDGFFEDDQLNMVWEMWQAATQRDGFKFVPVCTHEWSIQLSGRFTCDLCGEDMIGAVDEK